jgi:hypothetical protein
MMVQVVLGLNLHFPIQNLRTGGAKEKEPEEKAKLCMGISSHPGWSVGYNIEPSFQCGVGSAPLVPELTLPK